MKVLLDTNTCITIIKQKPPEVLVQFRSFAVGEIGISSVTAGVDCPREPCRYLPHSASHPRGRPLRALSYFSGVEFSKRGQEVGIGDR